MRTKLIGIVAVLMAAGFVLGQAPSSATKSKDGKEVKKSDLEVALDEALKNNPDLHVAAAKAAEADAQLARARAQVVQKVVAAYQAIEAAKAKLLEWERRHAQMAKMRKINGAVTEDDYQATQASVAQAKAAVAAAESELEYLTGKGKQAEQLTRVRLYTLLTRQARYEETMREVEDLRATKVAKGPAADRLRKALEKTSARVSFNDAPARDVLKSIQAIAEGSGVHVQANTSGAAWTEKVTAKLDDVPLSTVLQLLEDALGGHRVVVRDYGLLIAPQDKLPPNAITMSEFLKSKPVAAAEEKIEGKVTKVEHHIVTLSIGVDAGLAKGKVLDVYRLGVKPVYLGKVKVTDVLPTTAVAEVEGKLAFRIEVGDHVGTAAPRAR